MRKLVLKMHVSIDGFVSGQNGEADWIFSTGGDDAQAWVLDTLSSAGLHAMGSRTYRDMAAFWPTSDLPLAKPMNNIPKMVFTTNGGVEASGTAGTTTSAANGSFGSGFRFCSFFPLGSAPTTGGRSSGLGR